MFNFFKKRPKPQPPPLEGFVKAPKIPFIALLEEFGNETLTPLEEALAISTVDKGRFDSKVLAELPGAAVLLLLAVNDPCTTPLVLRSAFGYPMLAMFTQRCRTAPCQEKHPEQQFYLNLPFEVALSRLKDGIGIAINPYGSPFLSKELPPEMVKRLIHSLFKESFEKKALLPGSFDANLGSGKLASPYRFSRFQAGQVWELKPIPGHPDAQITILQVDVTEAAGNIIHIAVSGLNLATGGSSIAHMPFKESMVVASIGKLITGRGPVPDFAEGYAMWKEEKGGFFTVSVAEGIETVWSMLRPRNGADEV